MGTEVDALTDTARSEVKYWGGERVGLLHLAVALSKRAPDAFEDEFGADGLTLIKQCLRSKKFGSSDEQRLAEVLDAASGQRGPEAYRAVSVALRSELEWVFQEIPAVADSVDEDAAAETDGAVLRDQLPESGAPRHEGLLRPIEFPDERQPERAVQVDDLVVMLARAEPTTPVLTGRSGSGRSTVLREFAARVATLPESHPLCGVPVLELDPTHALASGTTARIEGFVAEAEERAIVCIDDVAMLLELSPHHVNSAALRALNRMVGSSVVDIVLTMDESALASIEQFAPLVAESLTPVDVRLPSGEAVRRIVAESAEVLAERHAVVIRPEVVDAAATARPAANGPVQPGLGISMLDSSCARAVLRGSSTVGIPDLRIDDGATDRIDFGGLCDRLRRAVVGQDHVVERVAKRLALTKAGLDLRPERPDGVFLFVGPTGVGKTEMARSISSELFGSAEQMIRLDMSEYVSSTSISRLIGPQPGYVGSTEPESWLTTRVMKQPGSVVLLDEIEKAHPLVWNTFLQVFDAGRLTDSRGGTTDFSRTVIIMTSNLGAEAYSRRSVGFGSVEYSAEQAESAVADAIQRSLSPELINRLDAVLMFRPLTRDHIAEIAQLVVEEQIMRIATLGYQLTVGPEVVSHLAESGYDPAFGARHLQRNVDRQLLESLAVAGDASEFTAEVVDGAIVWTAST